MGKFLTELDYSPSRDAFQNWNGRDYRLNNPLFYEADDGTIYNVPKGFITDGASIPRIFWRIYLPYGLYIEAAVLHDYLYRTETVNVTRKQSDDLMEEAMIWCKVNIVDRKTIHIMVRTFGWSAFKKRKI